MYQQAIRETAAKLGRVGIDPYLVEGAMRCGDDGNPRCLDSLGGREWDREVEIAIGMVDELGPKAEAFARSYLGPRR